MNENTKISLNIQSPNISTVVYAVQNDRLSRHIVAQLRDGSAPWAPPAGTGAVIRYVKPDGTAGFYDVDESGAVAITFNGSEVTLTIVEQALTVPGDVFMQLNFYGTDGSRATTFSWLLRVQKSVLDDATIVSSNYYNVLTAQVAQAVRAAADAAASAASISLPLPIQSGGTAGTTPDAGLSNLGGIRPNRLTNWLFAGGGSQAADGIFPINQRNAVDYQGNVNVIDRWGISGGNPGFGVRSSYCILAAGSGETAFLGQVLDGLYSETITVSALTYEGELFVATGTANQSFASTGTSGVGFNADQRSAFIFTSGIVDIIAAKVEIGASQTLAHQEGGAWRLNETPIFSEEFAKCQRFLVKFGIYSVFKKVDGDATKAVVNIPCPMGNTPTIINPTNISPGSDWNVSWYNKGTTQILLQSSTPISQDAIAQGDVLFSAE